MYFHSQLPFLSFFNSFFWLSPFKRVTPSYVSQSIVPWIETSAGRPWLSIKNCVFFLKRTAFSLISNAAGTTSIRMQLMYDWGRRWIKHAKLTYLRMQSSSLCQVTSKEGWLLRWDLPCHWGWYYQESRRLSVHTCPSSSGRITLCSPSHRDQFHQHLHLKQAKLVNWFHRYLQQLMRAQLQA